MRRQTECSWNGAVALLAILLGTTAACSAQAGEGAATDGVRVEPCASPSESCVRIRGYVKAGADAVGSPNRAAPPPLLAGVGALGQAAADSLNRGFVMLHVSGDGAR